MPLTRMPLPKPHPTHLSRIMFSYTKKISFWDGLKDMTKSSALTWPQNSPDLNPIKHSWDAVEQQPEQKPHSPTPQNPKELLPMIWCQVLQDTIRPVCCLCLDRSELLHWQGSNQHNIRWVVLLLGLITTIIPPTHPPPLPPTFCWRDPFTIRVYSIVPGFTCSPQNLLT